LVVVDEAHCISEWGHTFRPEYRQISTCIRSFDQRPVIAAFTASATPRTEKDIVQQLQLNQPVQFRQSVFRPNLYLKVCACPSGTVQHLLLMRLLQQYANQPTLIYCATRRQAVEVTRILQQLGITAGYYHAGLTSEEREKTQQEFLTGKYQLICATTAFGMGVDKPDIRVVIHLHLPASVEGYYQEVGRAGRDGKPSHCYLLTVPNDFSVQSEILENGYPPIEESALIIRHFQNNSQRKTFSYKELLSILLDHQKEDLFWKVLYKGEKQGWWSTYHQQKNIELKIPYGQIIDHLNRLIHQYNYQLTKLTQMHLFSQKKACRMKQLLFYFEPINERKKWNAFCCTQCDVCRPVTAVYPSHTERQNFSLVSKYIKKQKTQLGPLTEFSLQLWTTHFHFSQKEKIPGLGKGWQKTWGKLMSSGQSEVLRRKLYRQL
jgi:superfamily II DNA helicase RecQ